MLTLTYPLLFGLCCILVVLDLGFVVRMRLRGRRVVALVVPSCRNRLGRGGVVEWLV